MTVTKTMSTDHDNGNDVMLRLEIHVQISALAAPAEAHLRIATALTEVNSAQNHTQDCFVFYIRLYFWYFIVVFQIP